MTEPNVGRGRARGRGAELLAAWEASKRRYFISLYSVPTLLKFICQGLEYQYQMSPLQLTLLH